MILEGTAGYTLLGEKPVSVVGYFTQFPPGFISLESTYLNAILIEGHKAWSRYKHLFPSKKFELAHTPSLSWIQEIFCINKQACANIALKNLDHFDEKEPIYEKIAAGKFWSHFTQAQAGLLFGFGRKNSLAFDRSDEIHRKAWNQPIALPARDWRQVNSIRKEAVWWLPKVLRPQEKTMPSLSPSPGFTSLGEEYDTLRGSKASHKKYSPNWVAERILIPQFVPTSGEELEGSETDKLMKGYRETRKKLIKLSKSKHFLRDVLVEWMR